MSHFNWKNKKVLVTGAGGFIGSHLCECLIQKGVNVLAFVHYNAFGRWGWLDFSSLRDEMEVYAGDVTDHESVKKALKGKDVVFHLAALIGIPYSYHAPSSYVQTNIIGTLNVLQAAREYLVSNIIHTSTSETYGTAQYVPIDEKHPLRAQSPYAATKIGADQLAISFYRSFRLPVKIARPFNTYGPRQSARAVIPAIITQVLENKKEIKLGNVSPRRDLTYVRDTVSGLIAIAESARLVGEVTNIGNNNEISVGDLAKTIISLMGSHAAVVSDNKRIRPLESEVERLRCNNGKIRKITKWKPRYDLKDGLRETIEWIKGNQEIYKAAIYQL